MLIARAHHCFIELDEDHLFVIGGIIDMRNQSPLPQLYHIPSQTWTDVYNVNILRNSEVNVFIVPRYQEIFPAYPIAYGLQVAV